MSIFIRVKRKCDGAEGLVKSARGSTNGLEWVTVVFDNNKTIARNVKISHFDVISIKLED